MHRRIRPTRGTPQLQRERFALPVLSSVRFHQDNLSRLSEREKICTRQDTPRYCVAILRPAADTRIAPAAIRSRSSHGAEDRLQPLLPYCVQLVHGGGPMTSVGSVGGYGVSSGGMLGSTCTVVRV